MHLADIFIQSNLQCFAIAYMHFNILSSNAFISQIISQLRSQLCFCFYFFKGVLKETSETKFWEKSFNSWGDSVISIVWLLWTTFMVLFVSYDSHPFSWHRKLCTWMLCLTSAAFHENNKIRWGRNDMMVWPTLIFLEQTMARLSVHIPIVLKAWNSTDHECWSDRCSGLYVFIGSVWCYRGGQWSVDACPCCSTLWNHYKSLAHVF